LDKWYPETKVSNLFHPNPTKIHVAAGIYFAGFLISLLIPGRPTASEAVPAQDAPADAAGVPDRGAAPASA